MGRAVTHSYSAPGTYTVTLTVTNDGGKSASTSQTVAVAASVAPTADFVFSPTTPIIGQTIQFNASTSKANAGRSIVSYAASPKGKVPARKWRLLCAQQI